MAWVQAQERQNLTDLILARPYISPDVCSYRASQLQASQFFDVFKIKSIKHQHACGLMNLLVFLQKSPCLLAQCMSIADRINQIIPSQNDKVVHIICDSLYGSLINTKDVEMILSILQQLLQLQIVNSEYPRRMLRPSSSSFARLYQRLHSSLPSAKLFLLASLRHPVMSVLIEDQKMDLNGMSENVSNLLDLPTNNYSDNIVHRLFTLTNRFVRSLRDNWLLFPSPLNWLIQKVYFSLKQSNISNHEIYSIIMDMVFTHFICPAVVSPDLHGIIDIQVDPVAQYNLIQIGQILQKLALIKYQPVELMNNKLYEMFEQHIIPGLIEALMPQDYGAFHQNLSASLFSAGQTNVQREKLFITRTELNLLLDFLRTVIENDGLTIGPESRKELISILDKLPSKIEEPIYSDIYTNRHENNNIALESVFRAKSTLINLGKNTKQKLSKTAIVTDEFETLDEGSASSFINGNTNKYTSMDEVIVFPIKETNQDSFDLLSESEVININSTVTNAVAEPCLTEKNIEELARCNQGEKLISDRVDSVLGRDKHTRFVFYLLY